MSTLFSRYAPAAQEIYEQGYPNFEHDPDYYDKFWDTQIRRCIKGYEPKKGDWIPGHYYFHLNFAQILRFNPKRMGKTQMPPLYRDLDHEYHQLVYDAKINNKGIITLKARRKGFSINNSSLLLARWLFFPGSEVGVGAFAESQVEDIRNKIIDIRDKLPAELLKRAEPDNAELMEANHKVQTATGWVGEGDKSRIYMRCFGAKVGAFRGLSLDYLLLEEAGENPKLKACYLASEECFKEGSLMYGTPIIGGTAENMHHDSSDYQEMFYDAEAYNLIPFFVPASKVYYPFFDESTGKSDLEAATKAIKEEHAVKARLENKTAYYTILQEKPLEPSHAFMGDTSSVLPLDIVNRRIEMIRDNDSVRNMIRTGRLEWVGRKYNPNNPQVEWIPDDMGKCKMLYPPINEKYKNLDIIGTDTYFYNNALNSPSMGSTFVYRRFCPFDSNIESELPVFEYTAKESTTDEFYDNTLKVAVFYGARILSEYDESFGKFMFNAKALRYFKERPLAADSPNSNVANKYMIHMKVHQKTLGKELLKKYITRYADKIYFLDLLEEMKVFGKKNTDRVMSFAVALIHDLDNSETLNVIDVAQEEKESQGDFMPRYEIGEDGIIRNVYFNSNKQQDNRYDIS